MFEIEQKFELSTENFIKHCVPYIVDSYQLTQKYLDDGKTRIRKLESKNNTVYFITQKYKKYEREYEISRDAYTILESLPTANLFKTRFKLDSNNFEWHLGFNRKVHLYETFSVYVDIFSNCKIILELELLSSTEIEFPVVKIPTWFGKEILESNYSMLCKRIIR